jgi:HSP20 family molecular chaperone IbpA
MVSSSKLVSSSSSTSSSSVTSSVKSTSSTVVQKSSSKKVVTSSGAQGIDIDSVLNSEMDKMKLKLDCQIANMKSEMMSLMPTSPGIADHVKLDDTSIQKYIDEVNRDKVRFEFDVHEFAQETVQVKSDGNTIQVHAKKLMKKGDDESTEEYSRTYELPSGVDAQKVTSSLQKGGNILTIELPVKTP